MTAEQREAIRDAASMLESVDAYNQLPAYGRGHQYRAMAKLLRRLFPEQGND